MKIPPAQSATSRVVALMGLLLWPACGAAQTEKAVSFNRDIRPILSNYCFRCHGPDEKERKADLRLDVKSGALADLGGHAAIVPGKPEESALISRIAAADPKERMPPRKIGKKVTAEEIDLLTRWIKQGAPYARHWSYEKPSRPALPTVKNATWPKTPIDYFLLARLEREGLQPAPEADRFALIRRVSLDLSGLPPTWAEVEAFVRDTDPGAYDRLVDRLLEKPAYGEHWARLWLDLARYADSAGYADDPPRTIWLFRDYVIKALNANKPFDRFTIEQIAGDLLPEPTEEQLIATAFHRNTLTNNEGGTSDEEFRNVAVVDRVNTTMSVWMGTTIMCAQCHDHKYDPLSQEEYFRFFAIFNNTEDADRTDEAPVLSTYTKDQKHRREALKAEQALLQAEVDKPGPLSSASLPKWERDFPLDLPWYPVAPDLVPIRKRLREVDKQLVELKPATVPIMREMSAKARRVTKIQHRGNFLDVGKEVTEGTPGVFPPLPAGAPRNRLTLARWLVDPENPLTGRVIANRYWEQLFGVGIVATSEDFGAQGDAPYHPELLDWLATELVRERWDMKAFLRLLVTSAAYRQSSRVTPELERRDPDNRLLARGPRFRLSAEMVRDQALFVSGLLSDKMYGPSVKPPQPSTGLNAAFGSGIDWQTSTGEDRHRRALYTMWRRSNPYPSMASFDAPNREVCTVRRISSNTPLQALVTLNDPVFVEAAQALAQEIVSQGSSATADARAVLVDDRHPAQETVARHVVTIADKVAYVFQRCLSRPPQPAEQERLTKLYEQARTRLAAQPEQARKLAFDQVGIPTKKENAAEVAAWTVVANVVLNLDEVLMKR